MTIRFRVEGEQMSESPHKLRDDLEAEDRQRERQRERRPHRRREDGGMRTDHVAWESWEGRQ